VVDFLRFKLAVIPQRRCYLGGSDGSSRLVKKLLTTQWEKRMICPFNGISEPRLSFYLAAFRHSRVAGRSERFWPYASRLSASVYRPSFESDPRRSCS
jgi:hypothetical protein